MREGAAAESSRGSRGGGGGSGGEGSRGGSRSGSRSRGGSSASAGAAPGPATARESTSAGLHIIQRAARPDLMDDSGDSDGIVDGRRRAGHIAPAAVPHREAALRQRQAQLSPYIARRAEQLVTEIGHAPVTPSTPRGTMPVRGLTAGDMGCLLYTSPSPRD